MLKILILVSILSTVTVSACEPAICRKSFKDGHRTEECTCPRGKTMALFKDDRYHCFDRCDICPNGFCSTKVRCHCFDNMEKDSHGVCPQICPNCQNGWCSSPFKCECNAGFAGDGCLPVCASGCPNGYCSSPGICACDRGYKKSFNETCIPVCPSGCPNDHCIAPGVCSCDRAFTKPSLEALCKPVCEYGCEVVETGSNYGGIWNQFGWSLLAVPLLLLVCGLFAVKCVYKTSRQSGTREQVVDVMRCPPPDGHRQVPLSVFILN